MKTEMEKINARYVFWWTAAHSRIHLAECSYTPETYHMIGEEELKRMKSSAIFINTARGSMVDEKGYEKALKEHKIWAAALDVYEKWATYSSRIAWTRQRVVCPTCRNKTMEDRIKMTEEMVRNIIGFYEKLILFQ